MRDTPRMCSGDMYAGVPGAATGPAEGFYHSFQHDRDAEVQDFARHDAPVGLSANEDVLRLEISMDYALCVGGGHPTHGWQEQGCGFVDAEKLFASDGAGQRLSVEQLHHDARHSFVFDDVEDRHDIGVIDSTRGQGLAAKEALRFARARQGEQDHLQRDSLAGVFIGTGPHGSHSTFRNQMVNSVLAPDDLAWPQDCLNRALAWGFLFLHTDTLSGVGITSGVPCRHASRGSGRLLQRHGSSASGKIPAMSPMMFTNSVFAGTTIFVLAESAVSTMMSRLSNCALPTK